MARFVGNGARNEVEALLDQLGLTDKPRLRKLAAQALDPENGLRELDMLALKRLARHGPVEPGRKLGGEIEEPS
jgi:hypothetical protein